MKWESIAEVPWALLLRDRLFLTVSGATVLVAALLFSPLLSQKQLFTFSEYFSDLSGLVFCVVAFQYRLWRLERPEERSFWNLWTLAVILWITARGIHILGAQQQWTQTLDLTTNILYVAMYASVFLALGNRPYMTPGSSLDTRFQRVESTGKVFFAFGLLVYFVLLPGQSYALMPGTREPSFFLFAILDLVLLINLISHRRMCSSARWNFIYTVFLVVTLLWAFNDVLEGLTRLGIVPAAPETSFYDLLWHIGWILQFPLIVLAARSREVGDFPAESGTSVNERISSDPKMRESALTFFTFAFPCIHFLAYGTGLLGPQLRTQREICTLILLVVGGIATLLQQKILTRARWDAIALFRDLFEHAPVMYVITVEVGNTPTIVDCNQLFLRVLGYDRKEVLGSPLNDFCDPATKQILPKNDECGGTDPDLCHEVVLIDRKGKRIPTLVQAATTQTEDGSPARTRVNFIDISVRKHLEEQLRQAQKMEAVGQLAGGVAHDFNNLLTVINGNAELALRTIPLGHPLRSEIEEIAKAGNRASSLTHQLLAFSRRQELEPRVVQLNDVVRDIEALLQRIIGEDIQLIHDYAEGLKLIEADPGQLEQVIVNLAVNARDAMPYGGKLSLQTRNVPSNGFRLKRNGQVHTGPFVQLMVRDSGHGISEELIDRIFEPFFTTKEEGKGTGLGLTTVYSIIRQSGGIIDVESRPGAGTTFKILFPAVHSGENRTLESLPAASPEVHDLPVLPLGRS